MVFVHGIRAVQNVKGTVMGNRNLSTRKQRYRFADEHIGFAENSDRIHLGVGDGRSDVLVIYVPLKYGTDISVRGRTKERVDVKCESSLKTVSTELYISKLCLFINTTK